jgi:hypothetical protein
MKPIYSFLDLKVCIDNCKKKDKKDEKEKCIQKCYIRSLILNRPKKFIINPSGHFPSFY